MGGLSRRFSSSSSPPTPSITPKLVEDVEEDPVPLYFLDETGELSAGIEVAAPAAPSPPRRPTMGSSLAVPIPSLSPLKKKKKMQNMSSALRKQPAADHDASASSSPPSSSGKLKKLVRFLDRVEILPVPASDDLAANSSDEDDDDLPNKKQKTSRNAARDSPVDEGVACGLGRAGSPRSPNRSPNSSTRDLTAADLYAPEEDDGYLSVPRVELWMPPSPPPSWRIPAESLVGRQPHVRDPPRVRSPLRPDEEIDLMARDYDHDHDHDRDSGCFSCSDASSAASDDLSSCSCSDDDNDNDHHQPPVRPGVSYISPPASPTSPSPFRPPPIRPVIARKMWPHGEVRFEDQWGHRLIPLGRKASFKFDLWPVEENVAAEGAAAPVRGAWVRGRSGESLRRNLRTI